MRKKQIRDPICFRINNNDIKYILKNNIYDKSVLIKSLMRIALINNFDLIKNDFDKYDWSDKILGKSKSVYIRFNEGDEDLVSFMNQPGISNQSVIKRLMRIALINNPDLIKKSGLVKIEDFNKFWQENEKFHGNKETSIEANKNTDNEHENNKEENNAFEKFAKHY